MFNRFHVAVIYAEAYAHRAIQTAANTKEKAIEHKSELACIGGTAVVVGLAARVHGFKAGYEFATNS